METRRSGHRPSRAKSQMLSGNFLSYVWTGRGNDFRFFATEYKPDLSSVVVRGRSGGHQVVGGGPMPRNPIAPPALRSPRVANRRSLTSKSYVRSMPVLRSPVNPGLSRFLFFPAFTTECERSKIRLATSRPRSALVQGFQNLESLRNPRVRRACLAYGFVRYRSWLPKQTRRQAWAGTGGIR